MRRLCFPQLYSSHLGHLPRLSEAGFSWLGLLSLTLCLFASGLSTSAASAQEPPTPSATVAASTAPERTAQQTAQTVRLSGTLLTTDGQPVANARVELRNPVTHWASAHATWTSTLTEPIQTVSTNRGGRFTLRLPSPGFYDVQFHANGLASTRWANRTPVIADKELLPITLQASRTLSVTVEDEDGNPVAAARLVASTEGVSVPFDKRYQRTSTTSYSERKAVASSGPTLFAIGQQNGRLRVSAPGFLPEVVVLDEGSANEAKTVQLEGAQQATLVLTHPGGTPAQDAVVMMGRAVVAMAGDDGRADVPLASSADGPPDYTVHGALPLTGATVPAHTLKPATTKAVELLAPKRWPGRVLNKDNGKPVADAWVWASLAHPTHSNAQGQYHLSGPAYNQNSGPLMVRASAPGFFEAREALRPQHIQNEVNPTLALAPAASIVGTVVDAEGLAIQDAKITSRIKDITALSGRNPNRPADTALSRSDGGFELDPLLPNTGLELVVSHADFADAEVTVDGLAAGARQDVTITMVVGARVVGRVVDEAGVAILGASVELNESVQTQDITALLSQRLGATAEPRVAISDAAGDFRFESLAGGTYDLAVTAPTYAPAKVQSVAVPTAEELASAAPDAARESGVVPPFELGTITLSPGAVLEGVVRSKSGRTLEDAEITITESGNAMVMVAAMAGGVTEPDLLSDDDGRFVFDSLAPNVPYKIDVELEGFAGATLANLKAPTDEPVEVVLQPAVTLSGSVANQLGEPLANARISVNVQMGSIAGGMMNFNSRRMFKRASTDEDGKFEIEGLSSGKWDLVAASEGYIDHERKGIEVESGVKPTELRLILQKGATLEGTVTGSNGEPLAGVGVERVVTQRNMFDVARANRRVARTDGDGNYSMSGLPYGKTSFSAKHPTHQEALRDVELAEGDNRLDFVLDRGLEISGTVLDPTGLPVSGARVSAGKAGGGIAIVMAAGGSTARPTTTDGDGNFTLVGLTNGTYTVSAHKEGFADGEARDPVRLDGADERGVVIQLSTGASITGIVEGLTYDEMAQVQIMVIQPGGATMPLMAQVNYEGEYRLDNVAAGDWMVMATVGQSKSERQTITIEPGQLEMVVDFQFGGGLILRGRVTRNGQPESGTMVMLSGTSSPGSGQAQTGPDGEYVIEGLEPGGYQIIVTNLTNSPHQETIELLADQTHDIDIRDAMVSGRVIDEDSGQPLADVQLSLARTDDPSGTLGALTLSGLGSSPRTDAGGNFLIEGVVAGGYRLSAALDGYGAATLDLVVEGDNVSGIELGMKRSAALTVFVFNSSGTPARQVGVAVLDANDQMILSQTRSLAEGGRLDLDEIPDGTWQLLVAENTGGATARQTVTVPGDPVHVTIPPAGGLRLLVPELADAQLTARVTLLDPQGRRYQAAGLQGVLAGVNGMVLDGRALLNSIPVGTWTVVVETMDGARKWETVARVVEGMVTEYLVQ